MPRKVPLINETKLNRHGLNKIQSPVHLHGPVSPQCKWTFLLYETSANFKPLFN